MGLDNQGREALTLLEGETAGSACPWAQWPHSDHALADVANWLRRYHQDTADFVPSSNAIWREGQTWQPGLIVAHHDAAPYRRRTQMRENRRVLAAGSRRLKRVSLLLTASSSEAVPVRQSWRSEGR